MTMVSRRMENLPAHFFAALDSAIARLRAEGRDIIRLDMGSPDLPPPPSVIEALSASASNPNAHGYQAHLGPRTYREAWGEMYKRVFGVDLSPDDEIVPLIGTKEGIFHFIQAVVNPGDTILLPDPHYPTYLRGTLFAGGVPYFLPLKPENQYLIDLEMIPVGVAKRAKLMWVNYPNNPTGATATLEFFHRAVDFAKEYDIILCSDAAYTRVYFNGQQPPSILQVPGAKHIAVEFNSLSKSHNMAGWRVGALVGNRELLSAYHTLKTNIDSGQFLPILEAAAFAMGIDSAWIDARNEVYRKRRDVVIKALVDIGVEVNPPQASLYVWCPIPRGWTSEKFALALLEKTGVSVAPGPVFGAQGEGYIRISISQPTDRLKEAVLRIQKWWENLSQKKEKIKNARA